MRTVACLNRARKSNIIIITISFYVPRSASRWWSTSRDVCRVCGASTRRVRGAYAIGGVQQKGRDVAASSQFNFCSGQQRRCGVTIANCCCGSSGLQSRWPGTSRNACRVRGACSNLARNACASGKVPAVNSNGPFFPSVG